MMMTMIFKQERICCSEDVRSGPSEVFVIEGVKEPAWQVLFHLI